MSLAADIIKAARLHAGLSLRELARRAGTSHATLQRYEVGKIEPSFAVVERIVAACGLELRISLARVDVSDEGLMESFAGSTAAERLQSIANIDALRQLVAN